MSEISGLRRFAKVSRAFGFAIAARVAFSKVRGVMFPALALPGAPVYDTRRREVSFLLHTGEHSAATLEAVVNIVPGPDGFGWEVCLCERIPLQPETAAVLARLRGTRPWLRIMTADQFVDDVAAARWTIEQATGRFVAFVAPRYAPDGGAVSRLLDHLRSDPAIDAAGLVEADDGLQPLSQPNGSCRLLLQRKAAYLVGLSEPYRFSVDALACDLHEAGAPVAYLSGRPNGAPA